MSLVLFPEFHITPRVLGKGGYAVSMPYEIPVLHFNNTCCCKIAFPKVCSMEINWCYLKIMFYSYACLMNTGLKQIKQGFTEQFNIVVDFVRLQEEK